MSEIRIKAWLNQFGDTDSQILAFKLLQRLKSAGYFSSASIIAHFKALHSQIVAQHASSANWAPRIKKGKVVNVYVAGFQSTRPHGARLHLGAGLADPARVSIHAPARGATNARTQPSSLAKVSIHAPARGATEVIGGSANATAVSIHAPARGATCQDGLGATETDVSIHAPARGATQAAGHVPGRAVVSIHAPARGATGYKAG